MSAGIIKGKYHNIIEICHVGKSELLFAHEQPSFLRSTIHYFPLPYSTISVAYICFFISFSKIRRSFLLC